MLTAFDPMTSPPCLELDLAVESAAIGRQGKYPQRDWSRDVQAAHSLYDPLAKRMGWVLSFQGVQNSAGGWQVATAQGDVIAKGFGQICLAMCRAVLWYHLVQRRDDGSTKPEAVEHVEPEKRKPGRPRKS